jgi:spore germination protein KB
MDKERISPRQLTVLVISFTIGSWIVLPSGIEAWQNLWLIMFLSLGQGLGFAYLALLLFRRHPGKTLFEIHEIVYGPLFGKLFSLLFLWFFLQTGAGALAVFVTLLKTTVFTATPDLALLIPWVIIVVYGCRRGIEVIARSNEPLVLATIGLIIASVFLVLNIFERENLLPLFNLPLSAVLWNSLGIAVFPFGQNVLFLMLLPKVNQPQKVMGAVFRGMVLAGLLLSLLQFLAVGVLGKVGELFVFPTYEFYRMINIGEVLTRLELIPLLNFLTMGFIKIMLCVYTMAVGTAQLFNLRAVQPLVFPLGILVLLLTRQIYPSISLHLQYIRDAQPYFGLFFCLLLPLLTLGMSFLRGGLQREMAS